MKGLPTLGLFVAAVATLLNLSTCVTLLNQRDDARIARDQWMAKAQRHQAELTAERVINRLEVTCVSERWAFALSIREQSCIGADGKERNDTMALCRGTFQAACVPKGSVPSEVCKTVRQAPFTTGEWR